MEVVCVVASMASSALEYRVIVRVNVARGAHSTGVAMARRKLRVLCMVKGCVCPIRGAVASLASRGEELRLRLVARIGRVVVVGLVATDTCRRKRRVVVVHVAVTADARRHGMRAGEREGCAVVIEGRVGPDRGVMAQLASRREPRGCMCGIRRAVVVILVARIAKGAGQVVIVFDVAIGALPGRYRVCAGQRKSGAVVIEGCVQPRSRVVALIAALRKVRRYVIGIRCSLIVRQVARHAGRAGEVVIVIDVAIGALPRRYRVHARQRKSSAVVIKSRIQPRSSCCGTGRNLAGSSRSRDWDSSFPDSPSDDT